MSRLFQPIPAKPTFGVLQNNYYASDYIQKKKIKTALASTIKNQSKKNLSQSQLLTLRNCELFNNIVYNKNYLDKTDLIAGLYSKENLDGITTLCSVGTIDPDTEFPICTKATTINIPSGNPFYYNYNIDPTGALFGNTECGIKNFTNFMQIEIPIISSNASLVNCIQICNSSASQICTNVCSANS
jgi:hypothetical protein